MDTLWYTRCPVPTPVGLAAQLGLLDRAFAEKGVELASVIDSKDRNIRQSHFNHTLKWSFRLGGNVPPIRARSEGRDTRLIGVSWTDEYQAIIALPDSGIRKAADLAGRRLGVPKQPEGEIFVVDFWRASALKAFDAALTIAGLAQSEVQLVDIDFTESVLDSHEADRFGLARRIPYGPEIAALFRGQVDAIYIKGAAGIAAANLIAAHEVVSFGFHDDPAIRINSGTPRLLTVDATLLDERPDLVATLIGTIRQAGDWAAHHPEDTARFAARETGVSEEQIAVAHGPRFASSFGLSLDEDALAAVESYKNFLLLHGFLAADFSISEWADRRGWDQALAA
ncbi:ABC transporter substrate-binding protein [Paracoccus laeviglucosivorans]|uniref:ABC-type nitrate/sulfonate/bicarbonate transport system, substrate-binding protein n=1 Tax=Paracoccus laeviglucosivorans TaxID=1197861 RepID=A0A521ESC4_9RHOB|nr:ABC transporter substrate-binding protein [Paracoccus laeviglucosivorans]SMO86848.1 ABC-type nitrate/sulfonate/bicarbonate transport system, substrate-binding protein [Paracoccus laeviglucosivorans]